MYLDIKILLPYQRAVHSIPVSLEDSDILDMSPYSVPFLVALPPSLNFLSITGDYTEGGILTASYGYVGGHEGKSIYRWYLHEVCTLVLSLSVVYCCCVQKNNLL